MVGRVDVNYDGEDWENAKRKWDVQTKQNETRGGGVCVEQTGTWTTFEISEEVRESDGWRKTEIEDWMWKEKRGREEEASSYLAFLKNGLEWEI